jgi:hypothetical protein
MNYAKFVKEHTPITSRICEVLVDADVSAEDGELILLWLAGLSLGRRQASLTKEATPLMMLAVGWQVGAQDESDD